MIGTTDNNSKLKNCKVVIKVCFGIIMIIRRASMENTVNLSKPQVPDFEKKNILNLVSVSPEKDYH